MRLTDVPPAPDVPLAQRPAGSSEGLASGASLAKGVAVWTTRGGVEPGLAGTEAGAAGAGDRVGAGVVGKAKASSWVLKTDQLAQEVPVALVFNGISHVVMLASPTDLEDFALGFGLTEGIFTDPSELYGIDIEPSVEGISPQLHVAAACEWRLKERRRNLSGRTGCGLCGTDSLQQVRRPLSPVPSIQVRPEALIKAASQLGAWQPLQQTTGAVHAAAWCNLQGELQWLREDLGRHNALDKLIGALVKNQVTPSLGFVLITSRASFEMVQKTIAAGIGLLAAVSAPTALAVELAQAHNLTLAGFVRPTGLVAYSFSERLHEACA